MSLLYRTAYIIRFSPTKKHPDRWEATYLGKGMHFWTDKKENVEVFETYAAAKQHLGRRRGTIEEIKQSKIRVWYDVWVNE